MKRAKRIVSFIWDVVRRGRDIVERHLRKKMGKSDGAGTFGHNTGHSSVEKTLRD